MSLSITVVDHGDAISVRVARWPAGGGHPVELIHIMAPLGEQPRQGRVNLRLAVDAVSRWLDGLDVEGSPATG